MSATTDPTIHELVREGYAKIAESGGCCESTCCGGIDIVTPDDVARAVGYDGADLAAVPESANMGLSCGNPTAIAALQPGETVLDLGAGGGFDCFVAGPRVGAAGRVIGVDMTPQMLSRARRNIESYRTQSGLDNVEFRLGEIEHLPLPDASVDVVISNCVLNLSPDKPQAWREIARVLRPGGRVAISDLALLQPLPPAVAEDVEALVGCVAGAVLVDDMRRMAADAGLTDIELRPRREYIESVAMRQAPLKGLPEGRTIADYVTSLEVRARR